MPEITDLMDHYRIVARSIWNTAFWPVAGLRDWDSRDRFEQIKGLLFDSLVISRLSETSPASAELVTKSDMRVVPVDPGPIPIMIHQPREGDRNWYWDHPIREVRSSDAEFSFLDYFDWNELSYLDFQFYRVRIDSFTAHSELVGREALIDHQNARVFMRLVAHPFVRES